MKIRTWMKFFRETLLLAVISTSLLGVIGEFIVGAGETRYTLSIFLSVSISYILLGFMFGLLAHFGFFCFMIIQKYGLEITRSKSLWGFFQIALTVYVALDLLLLHKLWEHFALGHYHLVYILIFILISFTVSWIKVRQTKGSAFVPSIFYLIVGTSMEWLVAKEAGSTYWVYLLLFVLLLCNSFQILRLHRIQNK